MDSLGRQLKTIEEIISLSLFVVFAAVLLREPLTWRYLGAFASIAGEEISMFAGPAGGKLPFAIPLFVHEPSLARAI